MADNVAVTAGSGTSIATDDVGGVHLQKVKLDVGGDGVSLPVVGGQQTMANSVPVVIASNQGAVPISDNAGSLTVDDGGASVTVDNAALESLVLAEDAAHVSGDKGIMALGVRSDAGASFGADGDYIPLSLNGGGSLRTVTTGNNTSVGAAAHDAAVSGNPLLVGGYASAAAPADVSGDGDAARAWYLRNGAAATVITAAGALVGGDATNGLDVDVTRLPALPAGTNNIGDVDVLTLPSLPAGTNSIGTLGANSGVDIGDVTINNAAGAAAVNIQDGGNSITVDGSVTVSGTVTASNTVGAAAHDAAVSGNPVLAGSEARTSDGTAVANGDAVRTIADTLGKQVVLQGAVHDLHARGTANYTNTTASDLIAAAGAGVRIAVTSVLVTNAHATVGTKVEIRDGTTAKIIGYAAPAGGGFTLNAGGAPLFISTANTAVTGRNVTTGADVDITVSGYKIGN